MNDSLRCDIWVEHVGKDGQTRFHLFPADGFLLQEEAAERVVKLNKEGQRCSVRETLFDSEKDKVKWFRESMDKKTVTGSATSPVQIDPKDGLLL